MSGHLVNNSLEILRNTRPFFDADAALITSKIQETQTKLAEFETRSEATSEALAAESVLHVYHGLFSPIRKLPRDILQEIFRFCIVNDTTSSSCNARAPRWVLCRVCFSWRAIMTSTSSYWSSIILIAPFHQHSPSMLEWQLERSGNRPLDIALSCPREDKTFDEHILHIISQHTDRWRRLDIRAMNVPMEVVFAEVSMFGLPLLEEVLLDMLVLPLKASEPNFRTWMYHAPRLRRVSLLLCPDSGIMLPEGLTHFSGFHCLAASVEDLLARPSLVELNLMDLGPLYSEPLPNMRHDTLQLLRVQVSVLDVMTCPGLEELTIDDDGLTMHPESGKRIDPSHVECLLSFLQRSNCQLRNLHIYDLHITGSSKLTRDVYPLVGSTLVSVGLSLHPTRYHMRGLCRSLTRQSHSAGILPHMRKLDVMIHEYENHPLSSRNREALVGMLESRRNHVWASAWQTACLQEARLDSDSKTTVHELRDVHLREQIEGGLTLLPPVRDEWLWWQGPWLDREDW